MRELAWYEDLREANRPKRVRVLLIGESAPDPGDEERRFFYSPQLSARDNLYRGVVFAFYGHRPSVRVTRDKSPWLARLKTDGVFLIDLVPFPVNKLSSAAKRRARREHASACVESARALRPAGVIVCHDGCFAVLREPLHAAGLPLLHERSIPFPLGNTRKRFANEVRTALGRLA